MSAEQFKAQIVQMMDCADERMLSNIYHIVLHLVGYGKESADGEVKG